MLSQKNIPHIFETSKRSAPAWLDKGKGLLFAAEIINNELLQLCSQNIHSIPDHIQPRLIGLMDGLMLLLGLSIENAIKGFIVANEPDFNSIYELDKYKFNSSGGHGIKEMVTFNTEKLIPIETDLLERLEESIIWAGKYNAPKKTKNNYKNIDSIHPVFREKDFHNCSVLFKRIEALTIQIWDQNENLYWNWCDKYEKLNNK